MSAEQSRKLATEAFEAWRDGTAPILDFFDPAMTWRILWTRRGYPGGNGPTALMWPIVCA